MNEQLRFGDDDTEDVTTSRTSPEARDLALGECDSLQPRRGLATIAELPGDRPPYGTPPSGGRRF